MKNLRITKKTTQLTAEISQERTSGNDEKAKAMKSELVMLNAQLLQLIEQQMESTAR